MKRAKAVLLFLFLLLPVSVQATDFLGVQYLSCYDGDTCRFTLPGIHPFFGENIPVRIKGIDTPEKRGKCQAEKDLAIQARDLVRQKLEQAHIINLMDAQRGKYFRIVARVIADQEDISDMLIQKGLAVKYEGGRKVKDWCE